MIAMIAMIRFDDIDNDDNDDKKWHCYCNLDNYDDENDDLLLVLLNFYAWSLLLYLIFTVLTMHSAAPQTALWGRPGPRFDN